MVVRRDVIAAWQSEAKRELTLLGWVTVENCCFGAFRKDVRSRSPLDFVRRENSCLGWKHDKLPASAAAPIMNVCAIFVDESPVCGGCPRKRRELANLG